MNNDWKAPETEDVGHALRRTSRTMLQVGLSLFGSLCAGALVGAVLGGLLGAHWGYAEGRDDLTRVLGWLVYGLKGIGIGIMLGGGLGALLYMMFSVRRAKR